MPPLYRLLVWTVRAIHAGAGGNADPCLGDGLAHAWCDRLARGEWAGLGDFLRARGAADVDTRDSYIGALCDTLSGRPAWLNEWVDREPAAGRVRLRPTLRQ